MIDLIFRFSLQVVSHGFKGCFLQRESLQINGVPNFDPTYNGSHCPNSLLCSLLSRYKLHTDVSDQFHSSRLLPTPFSFGVRLAGRDD